MISEKQINWLSDDLESARNIPAIFIFTHHPLLLPKFVRQDEASETCKNPDRLFSIFTKYPVKAVFSGHLSSYYMEKRNEILYVTAGCGGFNKSDQYSNTNQYYIVRYNKGIIRIYEKKIPQTRGL
jgi:3',5'-cyclic AMP phosphodiesterase CpdA